MINILKNIGLFALVITGLSALGWGINALIPWQWLTYIFTIIRNLIDLLNFIWDIQTMWTLIGKVIAILILYWIFRATMTGIRFFREGKTN